MTTAAKTKEQILRSSISSLFFTLSLPAIISLGAQGFYHFVDGIFVGQWVGPNALGAVGMVYPITLINNALFLLIGTGSSSILSRAIGAGNKKAIETIFGNLLILVFFGSAIITGLCVWFAPAIIRFLGADSGILEYGIVYMRIIMTGAFFMNFSMAANMLIRGEGRMKHAMVIIVAGMLLNIILDPIMILVFDLGIAGAALATVIAQGIMALLTVGYFIVFDSVIPFPPHKISITGQIRALLSIGLSGMALPGMTIFQLVIIFKSVSTYGEQKDLVIISAIIKILNFIFVPIWGICQGFQPFVGMNYGARFYRRVRKGFYLFVFYATALVFSIWGFIQINADAVLGLFITDENIVAAGIKAYRLYLINFPVYAYMLLVIAFFQAVGRGGPAGFLVVSRMSLFFIPMILLLPRWFGINGVWAATPAADVFVLIIGTVLIIKELRRQYHLQKELNNISL